ncbi:hypothetical protein BJ987_004278 [Nocardia goodfellowii]|uniref:Uncharacterized protein n=1 Tax=Nocardia goodfellowii TaxID=882446 RepID=A0ABS4QI42_9NOCA|nr:hypothetical protein [Nocardia goodfellowii]
MHGQLFLALILLTALLGALAASWRRAIRPDSDRR